MGLLTRLAADEEPWKTMEEARREECRAWLRSCGGDPHDTRAVRVQGEGQAFAEVMERDDKGLVLAVYDVAPPHWPRVLYVDVALVCASPPPWWAW